MPVIFGNVCRIGISVALNYKTCAVYAVGIKPEITFYGVILYCSVAEINERPYPFTRNERIFLVARLFIEPP